MNISSALSTLADDVTAARAKITSKGGGVSTKKNVFSQISLQEAQ